MEKDYDNSNMNSNSNSNNGWNEYTNNNTNNDTNIYNEQYQSNSNQEVNQYNNGYYDTQSNDDSRYTGGEFYDTHQYQDTSYRYAKEEIPQDDFMNGGQNFSEELVSQMESEEKKPKKKSKNIVRFIAKAAAFGLIASVAFLGANAIYYRINPDANENVIIGNAGAGNSSLNTNQGASNNSIATTTISNAGVVYNTDVSNVVDETMPSIVAITSTVTQSYNDWFGQNYEQEVEGSGSGFIVGKNDKELLIVTNNHVVDGAKAIAVKFIDDEIYQAEIKGKDSTADLAVIAVKLKDISDDTMGKIKIATLGNSDDIKVGQMAIAIGNALGYGQSTTVGYISAKEREVTIENNTMTLLQTDAAINPGNSGGALLNIAGEVIGINSVKYADSSVEGMGFAIPITRAMPIINDLMNREKIAEGEAGFLGIAGSTVASDMISGYGWPEGVYIDSVLEGGPAEESGILPRDIVTKINDTNVATMEAMQERISSYRAGTKVNVTIQRLENGQFVEKTFEVKLKKKTQVIKEDTTTSSNSESKGSTTPDNSKNDQQTNPFSEFFGEDGSLQIPGFGN
nr:trypsin-like peptidase domain-containing protein [uncultured Anaerosporobacter sp.]